ncbi:MAG TPA: hypothetical protein VM911_00035 [Pyrinomonadaceae bacterium]|jgi:hypothetical protein|nr:hypothetical protein [Pyrinomonadaceae bacterium]
MKYKYMRYTIKGEKSAAEAQSALGDAASQGLIVRVDTSGGQTQVYIATPDTGGTGGTKPAAASDKAGAKAKQPSGIKAEEVSEADVTKIG